MSKQDVLLTGTIAPNAECEIAAGKVPGLTKLVLSLGHLHIVLTDDQARLIRIELTEILEPMTEPVSG